MQYDRFQDQLNLWVAWIVATVVGCTIGWVGGELLGRQAYQAWGWTAGHLVGWLSFELALWLMRWSILRRVPTVLIWRRLDVWIWFSAELFAWAIGNGIHQITNTVWVTASAVWGVMGGASIWLLFLCITQARPGRWWIPMAIMYTILGFLVGNLLMTFTMLFVDEARRIGENGGQPVLGWLLGGTILGMSTGAITGLAVVRLWFKPASSDQI